MSDRISPDLPSSTVLIVTNTKFNMSMDAFVKIGNDSNPTTELWSKTGSNSWWSDTQIDHVFEAPTYRFTFVNATEKEN